MLAKLMNTHSPADNLCVQNLGIHFFVLPPQSVCLSNKSLWWRRRDGDGKRRWGRPGETQSGIEEQMLILIKINALGHVATQGEKVTLTYICISTYISTFVLYFRHEIRI